MQRRERLELVTNRFRELFGTAPAIVARAPGCADLMGSPAAQGSALTLTLALERDIWIAAAPRKDRVVCAHSLNLQASTTFSLDCLGPNPRQPWSNHLRGVAAALQAEGFRLEGFNSVIHSTLALGSGLGSSAALDGAAATVWEALGDWKLDPVRKAHLCQRAEGLGAGKSSRLSAHYTCCTGRRGRFLLQDGRDHAPKCVKMHSGLSVVICDTKSRDERSVAEYWRRLAIGTEGAQRLGMKTLAELTVDEFESRAAELPWAVAQPCRFIIEENARVAALARVLAKPDREAIGRLTAASFRGACELYELGARPLNAMMHAILGAPGVVGARQTGAGFGGCLVALVERAASEDFAKAVCADYARATRITSEVYVVEPDHGAGLVSA